MQTIGLYLHLPFCRLKCPFCDLNAYAGAERLHRPYLAALERECAAKAGGWRARTLYLGGGTPSLHPPEALARLYRLAVELYHLPPEAEATLEAHPATVSPEKLETLRRAGFNRLSLGAQSFSPGELELLGRDQEVEDVTRAVRAARRAGFANLSLDLIYGLPRQRLSHWQASLQAALALEPDHLSLYALTIHPHTQFGLQVRRGKLPEPDPDLAADMYLHAAGLLEKAGYHCYEISSWARPGLECRHNLGYWRNEAYLGLGAGAHSWYGGHRRWNVYHPRAYIEGAPGGEEAISPALGRAETAILGLRLAEGLRRAEFPEFEPVWRWGEERDLLRQAGERVRLTLDGALLSNEVFERLLPEAEPAFDRNPD